MGPHDGTGSTAAVARCLDLGIHDVWAHNPMLMMKCRIFNDRGEKPMEAPKSKLERTEKNKLFKKGDAEEGTVAESIASEVNTHAHRQRHRHTLLRASRTLNSPNGVSVKVSLSKMKHAEFPYYFVQDKRVTRRWHRDLGSASRAWALPL